MGVYDAERRYRELCQELASEAITGGGRNGREPYAGKPPVRFGGGWGLNRPPPTPPIYSAQGAIGGKKVPKRAVKTACGGASTA